MTRVVIDESLRTKLHDFRERIELCDSTGQVLAIVLPTKEDDLPVEPTDRCPYSRDDLKRFRKETGGQSLADVWKNLGQA